MIEKINAYTPIPLDSQPKGSKKQIEEVASEFESLFIYYLLKTMRESVIKGGLFGSSKGEEYYRSMLDEELSLAIARAGGIGLKDVILKAYPPPQSEGNEKVDGFKLPVNGEISSGYGLRKDPFTGEERLHYGIDIEAPKGTPIHPAMEGTVIFSGKRPGYGNIIEIRHDNGYITRYAHNQKNLVKEGDRVMPSQVIALAGRTGRATGPHLHFEVRIDGLAVNPAKFVSLQNPIQHLGRG